MKLAYLTREFPFEALGEAFLAAEVQTLARFCRVHVIPVRPRRKRALFKDLGATGVFLPWSGPAALFNALPEFLGHPVRAAAALMQILLPRYPVSDKIKNLALFPKALAVARYVRRNQIDHIHAHWLTTPATVALVASRMTDIPWSCTGHAHDVFGDNLLAQKAASARFIRIISRRNYEAFKRRSRHDRGSTVVLHVGVELPNAPAPARSSGGSFRMLCPARLHPMKGHADLLQALAHLRDRHVDFICDLAGDGELRSQIQARISALQLSHHVTVRGAVAHDVLLSEMRSGRYDAIVLASIEDPAITEIFEGIPVALMEAMAAGIPCVSTRIGSIPELVDEHNGILVDQHDADGLARALELLANDSFVRAKLGRAARIRVAEAFDVEETAKLLYGLIAESGSVNVTRTKAAASA
jgi:glycosyltransferase involved in cell wall biosynthesis